MVKLKRNSPFFSAGADLLSRKYFEVDDNFLHIEIVAPLLRVNMTVLTKSRLQDSFRALQQFYESALCNYSLGEFPWATIHGQISETNTKNYTESNFSNLI